MSYEKNLSLYGSKHRTSEDEQGVYNHPKRNVFRFHYYSQFRWARIPKRFLLLSPLNPGSLIWGFRDIIYNGYIIPKDPITFSDDDWGV